MAIAAVSALVVGACAEDGAPAPLPAGEQRLEPPGAPADLDTADWPRAPEDAVRARVARVIDGDTVVLAGIDVGTADRRTGGRRVRLIGVDTPEVHGELECYGREASAFAKQALEGREVLAGFDVTPTDRYGRALAYLWELPSGVFFNARLVAEGYAVPLTIPPNVGHADLFVELARQAREEGRGLWSAC